MNPDPIAPAWVVFPIAVILLIAVAGSIIALRELPPGRMPESRRRIRIANGMVIMFTIPLSAYGFGVATTANPSEFVIVWTAIVALLCGIIVLAFVDMLNSFRLHRHEREQLRADYRQSFKKDTNDDA